MAIFRGTSFDDEIQGTEFADLAYGRLGDDLLYMGLGNDEARGGIGTDTVDGGEGDDWIAGGADADLLFGGAGNDYVAGGKGNDLVFGDGGVDFLEGSTGDDFVSGHGWMDGGRGRDYLFTDLSGDVHTYQKGGKAADSFNFTAHADGRTTGAEVLDFSANDTFSIFGDFTPVGGPYVTGELVFQTLDTNLDHKLDGTDAASAVGFTGVVGTDLHVWVADDLVVFRNVQALTDGQLA